MPERFVSIPEDRFLELRHAEQRAADLWRELTEQWESVEGCSPITECDVLVYIAPPDGKGYVRAARYVPIGERFIQSTGAFYFANMKTVVENAAFWRPLPDGPPEAMDGG